jgi:hypothetical protein
MYKAIASYLVLMGKQIQDRMLREIFGRIMDEVI